MKKTETAVYMLIFLAVLAVVFAMTKPVIVSKDGTETSYIKFWNFKKLA